MTKLDLLRGEIDDVDSKILHYLKIRYTLVLKIRRLKLKNSIPLKDRAREKEILNRIEACRKSTASKQKRTSPHALNFSHYAKAIFAKILSQSHKL
ncbi:MAG: chorismate mutase [Bdellovibrionales bacterium]|nr:chorismate mutase [Bdellovibrionales bacterium]